MGTEPFFIGSVPKGVHSRLWTFLGTERIQLERVKYRLHVEFCRSRSSFYPGRSNFFGRVNGPEVSIPYKLNVLWFQSMNVASHVKISRIQTPVKRPVCHKEPGNNPKVRIVLEISYIGIRWAAQEF